jgi:hypothetical protein
MSGAVFPIEQDPRARQKTSWRAVKSQVSVFSMSMRVIDLPTP